MRKPTLKDYKVILERANLDPNLNRDRLMLELMDCGKTALQLGYMDYGDYQAEYEYELNKATLPVRLHYEWRYNAWQVYKCRCGYDLLDDMECESCKSDVSTTGHSVNAQPCDFCRGFEPVYKVETLTLNDVDAVRVDGRSEEQAILAELELLCTPKLTDDVEMSFIYPLFNVWIRIRGLRLSQREGRQWDSIKPAETTGLVSSVNTPAESYP